MLVKNKLPRKKSLKSKLEIDSLLNNGHKLSGDLCVLFFSAAKEFKFATLVGRKLGNAVERNRIKRQFKEAVRLNYQDLIDDSYIAILPKKACKRATFEHINAEIFRLFKQINNMA